VKVINIAEMDYIDVAALFIMSGCGLLLLTIHKRRRGHQQQQASAPLSVRDDRFAWVLEFALMMFWVTFVLKSLTDLSWKGLVDFQFRCEQCLKERKQSFM
jgi:hypothetical protein